MDDDLHTKDYVIARKLSFNISVAASTLELRQQAVAGTSTFACMGLLSYPDLSVAIILSLLQRLEFDRNVGPELYAQANDPT
jgi:hypothetical protein